MITQAQLAISNRTFNFISSVASIINDFYAKNPTWDSADWWAQQFRAWSVQLTQAQAEDPQTPVLLKYFASEWLTGIKQGRLPGVFDATTMAQLEHIGRTGYCDSVNCPFARLIGNASQAGTQIDGQLIHVVAEPRTSGGAVPGAIIGGVIGALFGPIGVLAGAVIGGIAGSSKQA